MYAGVVQFDPTKAQVRVGERLTADTTDFAEAKR